MVVGEKRWRVVDTGVECPQKRCRPDTPDCPSPMSTSTSESGVPMEVPVETYVPAQSDDEGHFHVVCGGTVTPRYRVMKLLGEGNFAKVVSAWDAETGTPCAIKIVRSLRKYTQDAEHELSALNCVRNKDRQDNHAVVKYITDFVFQDTETGASHTCITFPVMGPSLAHCLSLSPTTRFSLDAVATIAGCLLDALTFLHCDVGFVHTDLKPHNILLRDPGCVAGALDGGRLRSYDVCLIDFGGALMPKSVQLGTLVSTRQYRAPEVVVGGAWGFAVDLWSLGCTLVECHTGDAVFNTYDPREHLAMMERVVGSFPPHYQRRAGAAWSKYFTPNGAIRWPDIAPSPASEERVARTPPLSTLSFEPDFDDFARRLLDLDGGTRIMAQDALKHSFLETYKSVATD